MKTGMRDWKKAFDKGQELILSTCSLNRNPNANVVISLGFVDGKLLIADCQMERTLKNLKEIKRVCIIARSQYLRARGTVEIFNDGKYYEICRDSDKEYPAKNAILVDIKEVFDLDKQDPIKI